MPIDPFSLYDDDSDDDTDEEEFPGDPEVMSREATLRYLERHPPREEQKSKRRIEEERERLYEDYRRMYS